jgi:hypothetical protein
VVALMLHDLHDTASVYLAHVLVVQIFVDCRSESLVFSGPFRLVVQETVGVSEDLLAERTLVLEVLLLHCLVVLLQVGVFNLVQVQH